MAKKAKKKPFANRYWRSQCDANHRSLPQYHYGWFRDSNGKDRVERINPTADYIYLYRTDMR